MKTLALALIKTFTKNIYRNLIKSISYLIIKISVSDTSYFTSLLKNFTIDLDSNYGIQSEHNLNVVCTFYHAHNTTDHCCNDSQFS